LSLSYLNVSNMPLSGTIPEALGQSSLFERGADMQLTPEQRQQRREAAVAAAAAAGLQSGGVGGVTSQSGALNAAGALGVARVLDASNAGLDGEWPAWMLDTVPATARNCDCEVAVFLGGNALTCPPGIQDKAKAMSEEDGSLLKTAMRTGLECREGGSNGRVVNLAQYVPGTARLPEDSPEAKAASSKRAGVIAGAVIGTLLGLALIIGLTVCLCRRRRASKAAAAAAAPGLQMQGWNGAGTAVQGQPLPGDGAAGGLSGLRAAGAPPPARPPPGVADYYTNPAAAAAPAPPAAVAPSSVVAPPAYGVAGAAGGAGAAAGSGGGASAAAAPLPPQFANADPRARSAIEALNKNIASTHDNV